MNDRDLRNALARRDARSEAGPPEGEQPRCRHCGDTADEAIDGAIECHSGCEDCPLCGDGAMTEGGPCAACRLD
jgi:hypothetical protein